VVSVGSLGADGPTLVAAASAPDETDPLVSGDVESGSPRGGDRGDMRRAKEKPIAPATTIPQATNMRLLAGERRARTAAELTEMLEVSAGRIFGGAGSPHPLEGAPLDRTRGVPLAAEIVSIVRTCSPRWLRTAPAVLSTQRATSRGGARGAIASIA
jgi:hypothetical protein